jgi:hypothetical protein
MKQALVIVDAWSTPPPGDEEKYGSDLNEDSRTFSIFLNQVCKRERKNKTIIIHSSGYPLHEKIDEVMSLEIERCPEDFIIHSGELQEFSRIIKQHNITKLYFCGFYFGRCIHDRAINILRKTQYKGEIGIVLHLSMVLPGNSYNENFVWNINYNKWSKEFHKEHNWMYYLWRPLSSSFHVSKYSNNSFEKIFIK